MPTKAAKPAAQQPIPVVVTTEHRGVFFGYATEREIEASMSPDNLHRTRVYAVVDGDEAGSLLILRPSEVRRINPSNRIIAPAAGEATRRHADHGLHRNPSGEAVVEVAVG